MSDVTAENPSRPQRLQFSLMTLLVVVLVASAVFGLIGRQVYWARIEAARVNNLKMIGLALHNYMDNWRCFPPAYIADSNGRPMHSWRVLLLPYLEHADLYNQYDFKEPWDGPNNSKLADKMPDCYHCPTAASSLNQTVYVAIVGERSCWPGAKALRPGKVLDGLSHTIMLMETIDQPVHWMAPVDAEFDSTLARIVRETGTASGDFDLSRYRTLFGDASVKTIKSRKTDEEVEWLLLVDDGNSIDWPGH